MTEDNTRAPFIGANQKIMRVTRDNYEAQVAGMQPSTIAIYDTIDLFTLQAGGNNILNFFQNVNSKQYPFTNLTQNSLKAGRAFAVQQFYFLVLTKAAGISPFTKVQTLDQANGFSGLVKGDLSLLIANQQVIERYPISGSVGPWNRDGIFSEPATSLTPGSVTTGELVNWRSSAVKLLPAQPIIIPNIEFTCPVQFPPIAPPAAADTVYLQLVLEGFGTLYTSTGTI